MAGSFTDSSKLQQALPFVFERVQQKMRLTQKDQLVRRDFLD